ncbi:general secretion pathway protein D [Actimicrobium sp. GrIS 1.19]|uniref:secretin N-terminal domain-containing protein n=1 Tax=Actimicrobium sp. GrIS 1.19 TaxID=3071708 RepID=UPI002DFCC57B|nr:general secretion pathway protein D [Actimicrobium sp. GrIS 1.19]
MASRLARSTSASGRRSGWRFLTGMLVMVLVVGCAAQNAFRDGKALVAQDKVEEGLQKFQDAAKADPANFEYRTAYIQTRERAIQSYLEKGDRMAALRKRPEAESFYLRAQRLDATNERARDGLRNLEMSARHGQLLDEADAAIQKKDYDLARAKLNTVTTENPNNDAARAMLASIGEKTARLPVESQLSAAYKKKISIEFKDVPIKQVFEVIARTSGLNFLFDKDVKTDVKTSIFLKNSTIESAVYFALLTNQLEQQVLDANTILIYPNTVAKQKDYQEMAIKSFFLTNADAKTVANTLKTILKTKDVVVDEKLNMLIVRDSADAIKLADKLVALHDVPEPEVMLEVEILEVKRTRLQELGIKWPDSLTLTPLATSLASGTGLALRDLAHQNNSTIGVGSPTATVKARADDTDSNLLANPRIRARNHEKAKILIGDRVPNITTTATATGFVSESITYVDVGLKLEVEPTIYLDNDVAIKVALEVSNIVSQLQTKSGTVAYQIGTRTASTVLRLKDGETQVLAGLINDEDRRSASKVPFVGEIPILGRLFGTAADDNQKTEIVLSITPRLIRNIQHPNADSAQFRAGTETSLRQRPDSGGRAVNAPAAAAANREAATATAIAPPQREAPQPAPAPAPAPVTPPTPLNTPAADNPIPAAPAAAPDAGADTAANAAQVAFRGPTESRVGGNFAVQLTMQSITAIGSLPVTLGFDPQVLQVVRVVEGDFLKQGGASTEFTNQVDTKGQVLLNGSRANGSVWPGTSGTVATVTFRSLLPADASAIQVVSIAPLDAAGRGVVVVPPAAQTVRIQ